MGSVGAEGRRLVAALEAGAVLVRAGADWGDGKRVVPHRVIDELARHDLARVRRTSKGERVELTPAGVGWTARQAEPDRAHRLLAERDLIDDAAKPAGRRRRVTVNLAESPLGWLKARGLVTPRQFEAGERLRGDWTIAQLGPRVTMRWEAGARSGGARGPAAPLDPTLAQIAAKRRTDEAIAAVGPGLGDVLWRVVCHGEGMEATERALGWPSRAGRVVLGLALDRLADSYGLG